MKISNYVETDISFYRHFIKIAVPIALQSLITQGVNIVDTLMLGSLNETALGGSSLANQFIFLCTYCCLGISMGTSVIVARCWGAKDIYTLKRISVVAFRIGLAFAAFLTFLNVLFPMHIMMLYTPDPNLIHAGSIYLIWSTPTYVLIAISLITTAILRNAGLSKIPFIASASSFLVNIIANYAFIFGKFGAPEMGVAGAALGTVLARLLETGILVGYMLLADNRIHFKIRDLFLPCKDLIPEFLQISLPVLISDGLLGLGDSALAIIMGHIGAEFVSANAITNVAWRIITIFLTAVSTTSSIIIGNTLGKGDHKKAQKQGYTFLFCGILIGLIGAVTILLIRPFMIQSYPLTLETKAIAEQMILAMSLIVTFRTLGSILTKGILRAGGDTKFLMLADVLFMWVLAIPFGYMAGIVWRLSAFWVFIILYSDQIIKSIWCLFRLKSKKWIKNIRSISENEAAL